MNGIWLLSRDETGHDEAFTFVVVAQNEEEARNFAASECGDEGESTWWSPRLSDCELIGAAYPQSTPGIQCRDFKAG